jgi:hypothetical protein
LPELVFARALVYLRHCLGVNADAGETDAIHLKQTGQVGMRLTALCQYLDGIEMQHMLAETPSTVTAYKTLLELGLSTGACLALQTEALTGLVELVAALPGGLGPLYVDRLPWLQQFMFSTTDVLRDNACRLVGIVANEFEQAQFVGLGVFQPFEHL